MRLRTLLLYLIGSRSAILEIARSRHALWISALFVLSAGFAREYDQEDLWHEPWHLLIPFGASLLTSFLLFWYAYRTAWEREDWPPFRSAYCSFLSLYWMTAPLAWLYAIPYERFLGPTDAVAANLWTLALVAGWRVFLMIRVLHVLMDFTLKKSWGIVFAFGTLIVLVSMCFLPVPLVAIMSGSGLTEGERMMSAVRCCILYLALPVGITALVFAEERRDSYSSWHPEALTIRPQGWSWGLPGLAVLSVVVWAWLLPFTQPAQQRRHEVESMIKAGQVAAALDRMSSLGQDAFPPHWDPPPRGWVGHSLRTKPTLWDILEIITERPVAPWVRTAYVNKLRRIPRHMIIDQVEYSYDEGRHARQIILVFLRLPEAQAMLAGWLKEHPQDESFQAFRSRMAAAALAFPAPR